jgi:predicted transcriptional regulator
MGFRLDPALLQELDTIANRSDRTRSGMVRHLIKQAVENSNRK